MRKEEVVRKMLLEGGRWQEGVGKGALAGGRWQEGVGKRALERGCWKRISAETRKGFDLNKKPTDACLIAESRWEPAEYI